jgi:drug/metabolite transporter (DMT)-like permease
LGVLFAVAFAFFYDTNEKEMSGHSSPASVFMVGFVSFVLGALPIWTINEQISAGAWNDRFALAPMLGASLMVMALPTLVCSSCWTKVYPQFPSGFFDCRTNMGCQHI